AHYFPRPAPEGKSPSSPPAQDRPAEAPRAKARTRHFHQWGSLVVSWQMRPTSLRPLVSTGVLAAGLFTLVANAMGQPMPEDEPMPPAMGRPPTTPPPSAAAP